jgi:hypothetical protein
MVRDILTESSVGARIREWLTPGSWVIVNEPSSFAPSSKWSNRDMDPGARAREQTQTSVGGGPIFDSVIFKQSRRRTEPGLGSHGAHTGKRFSHHQHQQRERQLSDLVAYQGLRMHTMLAHTSWPVRCWQSASRGSSHSRPSSSAISSCPGLSH